MAFGDSYAYKTNSRFVAAVAESDERATANPAYDGTAGQDDSPTGEPENFFAVDLVLVGFNNGRRNNTWVTVGAAGFNDVPTNTAVRAGELADLEAGTTPGETTGANQTTGVRGDGTGAIA